MLMVGIRSFVAVCQSQSGIQRRPTPLETPGTVPATTLSAPSCGLRGSPFRLADLLTCDKSPHSQSACVFACRTGHAANRIAPFLDTQHARHVAVLALRDGDQTPNHPLTPSDFHLHVVATALQRCRTAAAPLVPPERHSMTLPV